jgi:hypothetical protein
MYPESTLPGPLTHDQGHGTPDAPPAPPPTSETCNETQETGATCTLIEYMPHYLRASHEAARNRGMYPQNGAVREWVRGMVDPDDLDDWASVVRIAVQPTDDVARYLADIPAEALAPCKP